MKRSKLVEFLNSLDGNPDILLWNSHTNDYADIADDFDVRQLVKISLDAYIQYVEDSRKNESKQKDFKLSEDEIKYLTKLYNEQQDWEINPWVTDDEVANEIYTTKQVLLLKPVERIKKQDVRYTKRKL